MRNKVVSFVLMAVMLFSVSSLASCKKKIANDENTLEIFLYEGGYGTEFLPKLKARFEQLHSGARIEYYCKQDSNIKQTKLLLGPKNTYDLMFMGDSVNDLIAQGKKALKGYDCIVEKLDDVYEAIVDGKKVKDRMNKNFEEFYNFDINGEKHYYMFPWAGGMNGIVYNDTLFKELKISIPRTTTEMIEQADVIKSKSKTPFISSTVTGYWDYCRDVWNAQYDGLEKYYDFFRGIDDDGNSSREVFRQAGRLESLKILEEILADEHGRSHANINTMDFATAQAKFIVGEGLMMSNGDWFENEMLSLGDNKPNYDFKFMKTPIISSITHRMSFSQKTQAEKERLLRSLVDYTDGITAELPLGCEPGDAKIVKEARSITNSIGTNHNVIIPAYATAKNLAKEFLKFMVSEEGAKIYFDSTSGASLPFENEFLKDAGTVNKLTVFQKSKYEILNSANLMYNASKFPLAYLGGLEPYSGRRRTVEVCLASKGGNDKKTAKQIFDEEYEYYNESTWNNLIEKVMK